LRTLRIPSITVLAGFCGVFLRLWLKVLEDLTPYILWTLLNQMKRILFDQIAGIVDNTFEEMKEIQEILIASDALRLCLFRLFLPLMFGLSSSSCLALLLEKLSSNVLECLDISSDSPD